MYKVLLVDDEPLVLTGIKIMIDWPALGCELVGNARNGHQALEVMERETPDIVIADINMPVLDGIELLCQAQKRWPHVVFIMLTNLQEFELAQKALRHAAIDYVVKSQLEADTLQTSLEKAKAECVRRQSLKRVSMVDSYLETSSTALLQDAIKQFIAHAHITPAHIADLLEAEGVLENYCLAEIQFRFGAGEQAPGGDTYLWQRELVEELARNCLAKYILTDLDLPQNSIFLLAWGLPGDALRAAFTVFEKKLETASGDITGVQPVVLATGVQSGAESLPGCREQLFALRDCFYLCGQTPLHYDAMPRYTYGSLGLTGIGDTLRHEIARHNAGSIQSLFGRALDAVAKTPHEKSQALWLCSELYAAASGAFGGTLAQSAPWNGGQPATRDETLQYIETLQNEVASLLLPASGASADIVAKAVQYVHDNIDKRIMLQDAAAFACVSPGYLSALFKKQRGETFVDYTNRTKIGRAQELLATGRYRVSQIGYMLSYENAYYFTRVFKRYTGMTPTEYSDMLQKV